MKSILLLGGLLAVVVNTATGAESSPHGDATPTVESEIKRGMDAESACSGSTVATDFGHCIFAVENRNRQRLLDYNPFDIGLFFKAWVVMDVRANPTSPADHDEANMLAARQQAASLYTIYRAYQRKVGVTDELVITVSGLSQSLLQSRIEFWDNQPP